MCPVFSVCARESQGAFLTPALSRLPLQNPQFGQPGERSPDAPVVPCGVGFETGELRYLGDARAVFELRPAGGLRERREQDSVLYVGQPVRVRFGDGGAHSDADRFARSSLRPTTVKTGHRSLLRRR